MLQANRPDGATHLRGVRRPTSRSATSKKVSKSSIQPRTDPLDCRLTMIVDCDFGTDAPAMNGSHNIRRAREHHKRTNPPRCRPHGHRPEQPPPARHDDCRQANRHIARPAIQQVRRTLDIRKQRQRTYSISAQIITNRLLWGAAAGSRLPKHRARIIHRRQAEDRSDSDRCRAADDHGAVSERSNPAVGCR